MKKKLVLAGLVAVVTTSFAEPKQMPEKAAPLFAGIQDSAAMKKDREQIRRDERQIRGDRRQIRGDERQIREDRRQIRGDEK